MEALAAAPGALEDFGNHFQQLHDAAQTQQDAATSWEEAQRALGAKKALDTFGESLRVELAEDATYARFKAGQRGR